MRGAYVCLLTLTNYIFIFEDGPAVQTVNIVYTILRGTMKYMFLIYFTDTKYIKCPNTGT